jgi:DNA-binding protein HU-beta
VAERVAAWVARRRSVARLGRAVSSSSPVARRESEEALARAARRAQAQPRLTTALCLRVCSRRTADPATPPSCAMRSISGRSRASRSCTVGAAATRTTSRRWKRARRFATRSMPLAIRSRATKAAPARTARIAPGAIARTSSTSSRSPLPEAIALLPSSECAPISVKAAAFAPSRAARGPAAFELERVRAATRSAARKSRRPDAPRRRFRTSGHSPTASLPSSLLARAR